MSVKANLRENKNPMAASKTKSNFLAYDGLSFDEARLFFHARLHSYLNEAHKRLFPESEKEKKIRGKQERKARYVALGDLQHSDDELNHINSIIGCMLELIGTHSNPRPGRTANAQHAFFQKPTEHVNFFTYLLVAVTAYKKHTLLKKNEARYEKILGSVPIGRIHQELKLLEGKSEFRFKFADEVITEKQLYAAGVYYAMNFIFNAITSKDVLRLSQLLENMHHFETGPSYLSAFGKKGRQKSVERRNSQKDKARQIFLDRNILKKFGPKHERMASALMPFLRRNKIKISRKTVETNWLPSFLEESI